MIKDKINIVTNIVTCNKKKNTTNARTHNIVRHTPVKHSRVENTQKNRTHRHM